MPISSKETKWYANVKEIFFPFDTKISDVAFLMLFAPHCIVCNANYGKVEDRSHGGAPTAGEKPTDNDIWKRQNAFLNDCSVSLSEIKLTDDDSVKRRIAYFADQMVRNRIDEAERNFAIKNTNYKKHNFLHIYLHNEGCTQQEVFTKLIKFYSNIFDVIYYKDISDKDIAQKLGNVARQSLDGIVKYANNRMPSYTVDGTLPISIQMAQYMAALLLLEATDGDDKFNDLKETLLGIEVPRCAATLSMPDVAPITIKAEQYLRMCHVFLRSNPNYDDLHMVFNQLISVRKKANGFLNGEFVVLAQELEKAIISHGEKAHNAITQWPGTPEQEKAVNDAKELLKLYRDNFNYS